MGTEISFGDINPSQVIESDGKIVSSLGEKS
jgi:hypothetical protein